MSRVLILVLRIMINYTNCGIYGQVNGEPLPPSEYIIGAAAGGILDAMPEIVESAASAGICRYHHLFTTEVSVLMILNCC